MHQWSSKFLGCLIYGIVLTAIAAGVWIGWLIWG